MKPAIAGAEWVRGLTAAGVAALLVATPLIPSEAAADLGTGVVFILLWLLLLIGWLVGAWACGGKVRVRFGPADLAAAIFLLLFAASAVVSVQQGQGHARPTINVAWQWLSLGVCFFLVRQIAGDPRTRRALCAAMISLSVGLACFGFFQAAVRMPQTRADFARDPERVLREAGVSLEAGSAERKLFEDRLASTEPLATFALTNSLAGFLAPWLVLAGGLAVAGWRERELRTRLLLTLAIAVAAIGLCLLLTKSRTAMLAVAAGGGLVALMEIGRGWRFGWRIPVIVATVAGLAMVIANNSGWVDWLVISEAPKSLLYRLEYWQATAAMIGQYPWFGCGPGNFQETYTQFKLPQSSETIADPHNFFLEIAATAGIPVAMAFVAFLLAAAWRIWRSADGTNGTDGTGASGGPPLPRWVFAGAIAGLFVAFPIGVVVGFLPDSALLYVGLLPAAACAWGLRDWVQRGELPLRLLAVTVIALLINLLAAGGIGFAAVAQNFWVLLAIALTTAEANRDIAPRTCRRSMIAVAIVAAMSLLVGFYQTMYRPVLESRTTLADAENWQAEGQFAETEAALMQATNTDPWSSQPWMHLAGLYHHRWMTQPTASYLAAFERALAEALRLDPRSNNLARQAGDWHLAMAARARTDRDAEEKLLAAARADYSRWVSLYPNSALAHAQLAWALFISDDTKKAIAEGTEAFRLDALNPHRERKLAGQRLFEPDADRLPEPNADAVACIVWIRHKFNQRYGTRRP